MAHFRNILLGATALTAISGMALAQSNDATTSQNGNDNTLLIQQSQSAPVGQGPAGDNVAGSIAQAITQDGNDNEIDINQNHNLGTTNTVYKGANRVGTGGDQVGNGVDQIGNNNKLWIEQTGGGNATYDVQQNGGSAVTSNDASILQTGSRNVVSNISQDFNGNASRAGNTIAIDQNGSGNKVGNTTSGPRGDGSGITQTGNGNAADVDQNGRGNGLYTLDQSGNGGGGAANVFNLTQTNPAGGPGNGVREAIQVNTGPAANTADITQIGSGNGGGAFIGAAGNVAGVMTGRLNQTGSGNDLDYVATGDLNRFGLVQIGDNNVIDGLSNGTNNELAILQDGDDNQAMANQQGADNAIGASMIGNRNKLNMQQDNGGVGAGNSIEVAIIGNDNNNYNTSPGFSGDALSARDVARGAFSGLVQGDLFQQGAGNGMNLSVTGNANAFAMAQNGDNNGIMGTITHGTQNQAVVAQMSSGNNATFSIGGVGNNTGIIQGN